MRRKDLSEKAFDPGFGTIAYFATLHALGDCNAALSRIGELEAVGPRLGERARDRIIISGHSYDGSDDRFIEGWQRLSRAWRGKDPVRARAAPDEAQNALDAIFEEGIRYALKTGRGRSIAALSAYLRPVWDELSSRAKSCIGDLVNKALYCDNMTREEERTGWVRFLDRMDFPLEMPPEAVPGLSFGDEPDSPSP